MGVYAPVAERARYDFISEIGDRLERVQCKSAPRYGDVVVVRCYSSRRSRAGLVRRCYTSDEIDAIAAYCPDLDTCYYIPIATYRGGPEIRLRVAPTRNNQRTGIRWARDYDFAGKLTSHPGAIAQLGERVHGMHEVAGSSPAGSTLSTD